jgi:hypothetical protein
VSPESPTSTKFRAGSIGISAFALGPLPKCTWSGIIPFCSLPYGGEDPSSELSIQSFYSLNLPPAIHINLLTDFFLFYMFIIFLMFFCSLHNKPVCNYVILKAYIIGNKTHKMLKRYKCFNVPYYLSYFSSPFCCVFILEMGVS